MKKLLSIAAAAAISFSLIGTQSGAIVDNRVEAAESVYNYGEALQKSMFFYEAQQAGKLPDWNEVSWRDDSMLTDYIQGGWFDAGDHIKFTMTNSYSAAMLGWGLIEYGEGAKKCGQYDTYLLNLGWALDYIAACDLGDEVVYVIGDADFDHVWWGSAEVYEQKFFSKGNFTERPYFTTKASSVTGHMAAALAVGYMVFKDEDPDKAAYYLEHAENCFKIADKSRNDEGLEAHGTMYKSSHFYDELFWSANWLYRATGDKSYLDKAEKDFMPNLGRENQSTELSYGWGMCWDDTMQGGMLLYAMNKNGEAQWKERVIKHLDFWTIGAGGKQVAYTPDGLAHLTNWGALRHATTTAFLAMVACDNLFTDDKAHYDRYMEFAKSQMDYCFGDNDNKMSYVVGMGDNYPKAWHHRTSSGVWDDMWNTLGAEGGKEYAHTLYGALVGGPDANGKFDDKVGSYEYTEVAIDYNAGYTAALCGLVEKYGGTSIADFPPIETPKWDEFYIEACINQASDTYTELKVQTTNHSAWPARVIKNISYRYYMDLSEVFEAGYTVDDLEVRIGQDEFQNCTISRPIVYDSAKNIYYVEITYADGTLIAPTGQSEHQGEVQFRISAPSGTNFWNADNDYSFEGLVNQDVAVTNKITMYDNGRLIWGTEPDGKTPDDISKLEGDVNLDGKFSTLDLTLLTKYLVGYPDAKITDQGKINGDMKKDDNLNVYDNIIMRRRLITG